MKTLETVLNELEIQAETFNQFIDYAKRNNLDLSSQEKFQEAAFAWVKQGEKLYKTVIASNGTLTDVGGKIADKMYKKVSQ